MATKTKMRSDLEIAKEELVELQSRLGRAKDTHDRIEIELKELQARRLDPSASEDRNAQGRSVELRALLADETDAIMSLEHAIEERGKMIKQLAHDTERDAAAAACRAIEAQFHQIMDALAGHLPEMKQWAVDASRVHTRYASVNRSTNETLRNKMEILNYLADQIVSATKTRRYIR